MHELAMAQSILDIVEAEARNHGASEVQVVKLKIGEFTGVVKQALEFSLEAIRRGTMAEAARFDIEITPLVKQCPCCGVVVGSRSDFDFFCPACGSAVEIISGRELQVEYIEIA